MTSEELEDDFIHTALGYIPELVEVAKAASNKALLWDNAFCGRAEYAEILHARSALEKALKALKARNHVGSPAV